VEHDVQLTALDGYRLSATLYDAVPDAEAPRAALLCGGGGLPARVYRRFAAWLAARGTPVLTFDYRGIGRSRPVRMRGFRAGAEDWSEHDCAAAIAWLRARYPRAELIGVAHSIGGLILGGALHTNLLSRYLLVAVHTGYYGDYHSRWRWPMTLMWHGVMPALTGMFGYFPGRAIGMGSDLPAGFALEWAGRRTPAVAIDNARVGACMERCRDVRGRALALVFTDDGFATGHGTGRLLKDRLSRLQVELRVIAPRDAGLPRIGHFGFFRAGAEQRLWQPVHDWIAG
jgi:predicted alpha/beta hydrolase